MGGRSSTPGAGGSAPSGSGRGRPTGPSVGPSGDRGPPGGHVTVTPRDGDLRHRWLLLLRGDGHTDLEDAVLVGRSDVVLLDPFGQGDVADEGPVPELRPVDVLVLLLGLLLPLGADVEHTVGDGELDVLVGIDVGQLRPDDQRAFVDELLNPQPAALRIEIGHPAEHIRDLEPEPLGEVEALPAHQCHGNLLPMGGRNATLIVYVHLTHACPGPTRDEGP